MEEVMLGLMYELPEMKNNGVEYIIDVEAVERRMTLKELPVRRKESA